MPTCHMGYLFPGEGKAQMRGVQTALCRPATLKAWLINLARMKVWPDVHGQEIKYLARVTTLWCRRFQSEQRFNLHHLSGSERVPIPM